MKSYSEDLRFLCGHILSYIFIVLCSTLTSVRIIVSFNVILYFFILNTVDLFDLCFLH